MSFVVESTIPASQERQVEELQRLLRLGDATLTSPDGLHRISLPEGLYKLLLNIVDDIANGRPVALAPTSQEVTTQQAASFLGMSRRFLIDLLEQGKIPFHKVGTHRRIYVKDVLEYRKQRDTQRHEAVDQMARDAADAGVYDGV